MKRSLFLAPILLAGCSQEPAKTAAPPVEPTVLILQCDGEAYALDGRHSERPQQRRTYRIDLQAKTIATWNSEKKTWIEPDGENTVEISDTRIAWSYSWSSQQKGEEGIVVRFTDFDRTLGTISSKQTVVVTGGKLEDAFTGQCVKVDEPSTERAF